MLHFLIFLSVTLSFIAVSESFGLPWSFRRLAKQERAARVGNTVNKLWQEWKNYKALVKEVTDENILLKERIKELENRG